MTDTLRGIIARALQEAAMAPDRDQPLRLLNWTATAYADATLAAIEASGFVLVPLEPTAEMVMAGCRALEGVPRDEFMAASLAADRWAMGKLKMPYRYRAMIAAAGCDWHAALAAPPQAPQPPVYLDKLTDEQRAYFADLKERHVSYDPEMTIGGLRQVEGAAPQLGDAERRIKAKRGQNWLYAALEMIGDSERTDHDLAKLIVENETDLLALIKQLDAAQSALAESQAEVARLKEEYMLRDVQATGAALELDEARAELARPRSLTATGEDDLAQAREIVEAFPSYAFDRSHTKTLAKEVAFAIVAARAQGERDGIEKAAQLCEADAHTNTPAARRAYLAAGEPIKAAAWEAKWLAAKVRALAAPEPQEEEKHDG